MNFFDAIENCFTKYADFDGRAPRAEYWWFVLFLVAGSIGSSLYSELASNLFGLAMFLPSFAVATRRLHDTERSGWMQLLILLPVIGWIVLLAFMLQKGKNPNRYGPPQDHAVPSSH